MRRWALLGLAVGLAISCGRSGFLGGAGPTPSPSATPTATPWLGNYGWRRQILVSPSVDLPAGYTLPVAVNHAALVTTGHALASGADVRVARQDASGPFLELDRVLDDVSAWNTTATTILFRTSAAIPAASTATFWLFYGDPTATSPPASPANVFFFADGFENGLLSWASNQAGSWALSSTHVRSGSSALMAKPVNNTDTWMALGSPFAGGIALRDLRFDAWWYLSQVNNTWDLAQGFRAGPAAGYYDLESNLTNNGGFGLDLATYDAQGSNFNQLASPRSPPGAGVWTRVTLYAIAGKMRVVVNGRQVNPANGFTDISGAGALFQSAGTVSFRSFNIPGGQGWWIDDVSVRRAVDPEPSVTLGPEQPKS